MAGEGLVVGTGGNVSVRRGGWVLITPSALAYEEMRPADIVTVSLGGEVVRGGRVPSRELATHLAIYRAREDVEAIVHTHSTRATAWSALGSPLDTATEELDSQVGGAIGVVPDLPPGSPHLGPAVVSELGDRSAVLLQSHGAFGVGATLSDALDACRAVERQAEIAWLLRLEGPA